MADKKNICDCGCFPIKQNSAKATKDEKNAKESKKSKKSK
jgi:hypothetical protein